MAGLVASASRVFGTARYASLQVPTYPAGQIGALVVSEKSSRGSEQEYADLVDFVALGGKGGVSRFEKAPNLAPLSYSHGQ